MKIEKSNFGGAECVTLKNSVGLEIKLSALGAGIMSVKLPDRDGVARELTRLPDSGYGKEYHGMTIGRTSGRIENAEFTLDGHDVKLEKNNYGVDNLHGGSTGLHSKLFSMTMVKGETSTDVVFKCESPDGEGGYFGNVKVTITYRIYEKENRFAILFDAVPDTKTLLNLTNHVYWNMSGDLRAPTTEQVVYLNASRVGVLNERLIVQKISEVPEQFDFRTPKKPGLHINDEFVQRYTHGYDHPFFLDDRGTDKVACSLYSELSGIKLSVKTTYPCVVVYGDNFGGYKAICFECQYHPDGIHACPDDCGVCSPEKPYSEVMEYIFEVE